MSSQLNEKSDVVFQNASILFVHPDDSSLSGFANMSDFYFCVVPTAIYGVYLLTAICTYNFLVLRKMREKARLMSRRTMKMHRTVYTAICPLVSDSPSLSSPSLSLSLSLSSLSLPFFR